jgi:hypothetical protein
MEYDTERGIIKSEKILNELDEFIIDFVKNLKEYVIVSGYVSILLGRSRGSEDIDLLVPKMNENEFDDLWEKLMKNSYECINTSKKQEAYEMLEEHAIRFYKDVPIPNIEFKVIKNNLDKYSFENKIKVTLKEANLFISPMEMQIAYKLFLGSDKDIEDAKHIYKLFEEKIDQKLLLNFLEDLKVQDKMELIK